MRRLPETALNECLRELRASCRLPVNDAAIQEMASWVRPNFERILGHPDGAKRWADHGQRMRDNGRHLGAFADFFANHNGATEIGIAEIKRAFQVIRADCTVRAERRPVAWEYCNDVEPEETQPAEEFLRAMAPVPEPV
jgi:hypothetical protein